MLHFFKRFFFSAYDYTIPALGKVLAKTDIQIALPDGCYGRVAPRSGLAHKHFIDVGAGVIDQDYRGNVGVILFNFGSEKFDGNDYLILGSNAPFNVQKLRN